MLVTSIVFFSLYVFTSPSNQEIKRQKFLAEIRINYNNNNGSKSTGKSHYSEIAGFMLSYINIPCIQYGGVGGGGGGGGVSCSVKRGLNSFTKQTKC